MFSSRRATLESDPLAKCTESPGRQRWRSGLLPFPSVHEAVNSLLLLTLPRSGAV